ncbi:MAG: hypothetical protein SFT90_02670 [Rickettsiales bacterium]|nr:hypothetical protein [Rickettsiales bacterium]
MPQLEQIDSFTSQIFWLFAFFGLIYFFIAKMVAPKITNIVDTRETMISGNIETASKAKDEAKTLFETLSKKLNLARNESFEMVSKASNQANKFYNDEINSAEQNLVLEFTKAEKEILQAKEEALEILKKESASFVEDVIGKFANLKVEKQLIEKALSIKN